MLIEHLNRQLREREGQGLLRQRRSAESPCAPLQRVAHPGQPARDVLAFCSNDYLGLANHPALIEALADGALRYGAGSGASHLINGHSHAHAALEDDLAAWLAPCIPGRRRCSSAPATWPTWPCSPRSATPRQRSSPTSSTTPR